MSDAGQRAPSLGEGVHVWWVTGGLSGVGERELHATLDVAERARADAFKHAGARRDFVVGRALLRTCLSSYVDVSPQAWRFVVGPYGRPDIDEPRQHRPGASDGLRFNLSHTRGVVACAIARRAAVGVDVEHLARRTQTLRVADRYFAPAEVEALRALPADEQRARFFDLWTLKESYIKARGMGLAIPLARFWFELEAPALRFHTAALLEDPAEAWQFALYDLSPGHRLALCVARGGGAPCAITCLTYEDLERPTSVQLTPRLRSAP